MESKGELAVITILSRRLADMNGLDLRMHVLAIVALGVNL